MTSLNRKREVTGSQKWLQVLVNQYPDVLNRKISGAIGEPDVEWLSPLAEDKYREHRLQWFLDRLDIHLGSVPLAEFWPQPGPRWDGLARTKRGTVLLVEAKSHAHEMKRVSTTDAKSEKSKALIRKSLEATRRGLGASESRHSSLPS